MSPGTAVSKRVQEAVIQAHPLHIWPPYMYNCYMHVHWCTDLSYKINWDLIKAGLVIRGSLKCSHMQKNQQH